MGNTFYFEWEVQLMEAVQSIAPTIGKWIASILTMCGEQYVLVIVMGFLYWSYDKKYGKFLGVNILVGTVWNPLIKNVFCRRRPYFDHPGIKCLKPVEAEADIMDIAAQGYSFPSGHSMNSVAIYGSLPVYDGMGKKHKWITVVAFVMPFLIGLSRIYLGVHYPTDVMVGWAVGVLLVFLVSFLQRKIKKSWVLYLIIALTGVPGLFYCTSDDYFTCFGLMIGAFAGFLFEEHFVKFENTKSPVRMVLRVIGGGLVYLVINVGLKLPFSKEFLACGSVAAHMVRLGRYLFVGFGMVGLYPMLFKYTAKIGSKK